MRFGVVFHLMFPHSCTSQNPVCNYKCPQKRGDALCVYSIMKIGKALSKEKLRRGTYAKVRRSGVCKVSYTYESGYRISGSAFPKEIN